MIYVIPKCLVLNGKGNRSAQGNRINKSKLPTCQSMENEVLGPPPFFWNVFPKKWGNMLRSSQNGTLNASLKLLCPWNN